MIECTDFSQRNFTLLLLGFGSEFEMQTLIKNTRICNFSWKNVPQKNVLKSRFSTQSNGGAIAADLVY